MDAPSKLSDLLPGLPAKWSAFLSIFLSGSLYALLPWMLSDTPIDPALAQKMSILLLAAIPLLVGSLATLVLVIRHISRDQNSKALLRELNESYQKSAPRIKNIRKSQ